MLTVTNRYLHMHVMSNDLAGEAMEKSKHFFSFHPTHGEFLLIDDVLEWFDIRPEVYRRVSCGTVPY